MVAVCIREVARVCLYLPYCYSWRTWSSACYVTCTSVCKKRTFCSSHSLLSRGQTLRLLSHLLMQWKWNACWCMAVLQSAYMKDKRVPLSFYHDTTYITCTPCRSTFFVRSWCLIRLTFDACYRIKTCQYRVRLCTLQRWSIQSSMRWFLQIAQFWMKQQISICSE